MSDSITELREKLGELNRWTEGYVGASGSEEFPGYDSWSGLWEDVVVSGLLVKLAGALNDLSDSSLFLQLGAKLDEVKDSRDEALKRIERLEAKIEESTRLKIDGGISAEEREKTRPILTALAVHGPGSTSMAAVYAINAYNELDRVESSLAEAANQLEEYRNIERESFEGYGCNTQQRIRNLAAELQTAHNELDAVEARERHACSELVKLKAKLAKVTEELGKRPPPIYRPGGD